MKKFIFGGLMFTLVASGFFVPQFSEAQSPSLSASVKGTVAPVIKVMSPNGGETLKAGKAYKVAWTTADFGKRGVTLQVMGSDGTVVKGLDIVKNTSNDGSYTWKIPSSVVTGKYKIVASSYGKGVTVKDVSDSYFKIVSKEKKKEPKAPVQPVFNADVDRNGVVDGADLNAVIEARGSDSSLLCSEWMLRMHREPASPEDVSCPADVNGNGVIGPEDHVLVIRAWQGSGR